VKNNDNPGHEAYSPEGEDPNPWDEDVKTIVTAEAPSFDMTDVPSPISDEPFAPPVATASAPISPPARSALKPSAPKKIARAVRPVAGAPARTTSRPLAVRSPVMGGSAPSSVSRRVAPRTSLAQAAAQPSAQAVAPPSSRSVKADLTPSHVNALLTDYDTTVSVSREELDALNAVASSDEANDDEVTVETHHVDSRAQNERATKPDDVPDEASRTQDSPEVFAWGREPARDANVDPLIASSEQFNKSFGYASFGQPAPHSPNDAATRVYPAMQSASAPSIPAAASLATAHPEAVSSSQRTSWDSAPSPSLWPPPLQAVRDTDVPERPFSWPLLALILVCLAIFVAGIVSLVLATR